MLSPEALFLMIFGKQFLRGNTLGKRADGTKDMDEHTMANLHSVNANNATPKLNRDLRVRKIVLRLLQRAHS